MNKSFKKIAATSFVFVAVSTLGFGTAYGYGHNDDHRVLVCYKGRELTIDKHAANNLISKHNATLGSCVTPTTSTAKNNGKGVAQASWIQSFLSFSWLGGILGNRA